MDRSIMWHRLRECTISLPKSNTFLSVSLYVHIYVYIDILYIYIYTYIYIYACTRVYIYIYGTGHSSLYLHIYIYTKYLGELYPSIYDEVKYIVFHLSKWRYDFHSEWGNEMSMEMMPRNLMPHLIYKGTRINVIQWDTL